MKKTIRLVLSAALALTMLLCIAACEKSIDTAGLWEGAAYKADSAVGEGGKAVSVEVTAGEKSVILTVKTDKDTLGEALFELGIVNDPSFFNVCNGIVADWNRDQAYWQFKIDGKAQNYGIGEAKISGGESFTLEYTK